MANMYNKFIEFIKQKQSNIITEFIWSDNKFNIMYKSKNELILFILDIIYIYDLPKINEKRLFKLNKTKLIDLIKDYILLTLHKDNYFIKKEYLKTLHKYMIEYKTVNKTNHFQYSSIENYCNYNINKK